MLQNAFEEAIQYTREAVSINNNHTALAQRSFLAHSYFNLALIYDRINLQVDSQSTMTAVSRWRVSLPRRKRSSPFPPLRTRHFLFFQSGDYQKCIDNADKGILMAVSEKDVVSEAMLLLQKGQAQLALNDLVSAEQNVGRMIGLLEQGEGVSEYLASAYPVYAKLLIKKGKQANAEAYYKKAATASRKTEHWEQYARDLQDLAFFTTNLGDPVKAISCYREAIELAKQLRAVDRLAALYNNMGALNWRQKNYRTALAYYQKGLAEMTNRPTDTTFTALIPLPVLQMTTNDNFITTLLANKGESFSAPG